MTRRFLRLALGSALLFSSVVNAQQFPILDEVAGNIVQKYQQSSCELLWQEKGFVAIRKIRASEFRYA